MITNLSYSISSLPDRGAVSDRLFRPVIPSGKTSRWWGICFLLLSVLPIGAEPLPFYQIALTATPSEHRIANQVRITLDSLYYSGGEFQLMLASETRLDTVFATVPITLERQQVDEGIDLLTIRLAQDYPETIELNIQYELQIPPDHPINRISAAWLELNIDSFWLPVLVDFPKFTYELRLDLGADYRVLSGDFVTASAEDGFLLRSRFPRLDISFCAAPDFYTAEGKYVDVYATNEDLPLDSVLHLADQAMQFLETYIDEPADFTDQRTVVISPREEVGYARKNYIVLSDIAGRTPEDLSAFLAHEFSHYWFSDALLSSRHHWLTESFAEYLSNIYLREVYGTEAFQREMIQKIERIEADSTTLAEYTGRPSYLALYHRGPLVLQEFESYLGQTAFQELINGFIDRKVSTNEALFQLVRERFGAEAVRELQRLWSSI